LPCCGAFVALWAGVDSGFVVLVPVGAAAGFVDGASVGVADGEAEAEADRAGEAGRFAAGLVGEPPGGLPGSALPDRPPCSLSLFVGEPAARTVSAPPLLLPPSL
jgi:hypothetical protein